MVPEEKSSNALTGKHRSKLFRILVILILVAAVVIISISITLVIKQNEVKHVQGILEPFYTPPPDIVNNVPGDILRSEPLPIEITGAQAWRILYLSEQSNGQKSVVSGIIIAPTGPVPDGGRPVVAWAHPTMGMNQTCAPSRKTDPFSGMSWLQTMLANNWIIVATDYYGLGTPGVLPYLVGEIEAYDVINSVRAAIRLEDTGAGNRYALWGHSQGGHAVLWAAQISDEYAPELQLVGTAAAAPASELVALMSQQYDKVVAWVIGPEVMVSWPYYYQKVSVEKVATRTGKANYIKMSQLCLLNAGYAAVIRENVMGEQLFSINPVEDEEWYRVASENTPSPPGNIPVLIVQSITDKVVLPDTTALLVERYYAEESPLNVIWLDGISHNDSAKVCGPLVNTWLQQRFAGVPPVTTKGTVNPVSAADY